MSKLRSEPEMPGADNRELTANELDAVVGGTIVQVNGGGNIPNDSSTSSGGAVRASVRAGTWILDVTYRP